MTATETPIGSPADTWSTTAGLSPWAQDANARLARVRALLRDPEAPALFLTGAGISAGAGLPTYRGPGGLYPSGALPMLRAADYTSANIHLLWEHLATVTRAQGRRPAAAHVALSRFSRSRGNVSVVTQNVDGLHALAGHDEVLELHGSARRARCLNPACGTVRTLEAGTSPGREGRASVPRCECGARMRPDVVLFGEQLDHELADTAWAAARDAAVVVVVGSSLLVHPAATLIEHALGNGAAGAWLDVTPGALSSEMDPGTAAAFRLLAPMPGLCDVALPDLLDTAPF